MPLPWEPLKGYILDLSHLNGLPDSRWIPHIAGLSPRYASARCDLAELESLTDCPRSDLEALATWPIPGEAARVNFTNRLNTFQTLNYKNSARQTEMPDGTRDFG